jgi:hypothetical protein
VVCASFDGGTAQNEVLRLVGGIYFPSRLAIIKLFGWLVPPVGLILTSVR